MNYSPIKNLLDNYIILVTGASDGIGRSVAISYAKYGARLILLSRNEKKLLSVKQTIEKMGYKEAMILPFDLACQDPKEYQNLINKIAKKNISHIDGLLNNAGLLGTIMPIAQQDPFHWKQVIDVNINGTFMITQTFLPLLLNARSPSIIFTTSSVGRKGRAHWGAYAVSKFATEGMMQVLSHEYDPTLLRVNCINPGAIRTHMRASAFPNENPMNLKSPNDITLIYLYLMGSDSKGKTGLSYNAYDFL
ncbi:YciK family oxidoreductase [Candidatus Schneideria nysicola]|uniref:YciK family oxidoreductase n=1 Tax=Candidatus Schneideria nysicola TaxID=1081631 RepID=UPI001CAA76BD|nr:YciK family oxidoreductase [Candidatus Schneideria nysicola]UAJ65379.1 YciK family oxidoreductase [Candidatus Schneideria nysicola]